jgi:hypothetical protein
MATTTLASFEQLEHFLASLNYNGIDDVCAILPVPLDNTSVFASVHFAYCTDPEGQWFVLEQNPAERVREDALGFYTGFNHRPLSTLEKPNCQYDVMHPPIYEEPAR